ncbi:Glyoxalase/Bleomycin resistance protein/Dioxygenase superfamily protein [Seinonella peptonophila]|uniref:Glyoxalase/Bleomycin resistance protein/Dioxygenase superfamily protein n=1 Tax=Seinonella peptonophila TaxID=112248 RepID=A0A1M4XKY3_9BACL|nr:VOC family protein [Seinonella peptonophila]SHE94101.1 Glyoxalase/Bleomycin resistance protein/Dioxygenase superfamily protein [Seinonella peptonophila]
MILNHLNLTVPDVTATKEFLEKYFDLKTYFVRGKGFALLRDNHNLMLSLMKGTEVKYPQTFHIGFGQESKEKVNQINQRLKEDGFDVKPPEQLHNWTFYVMAPGNFNIEVFYQEARYS